MTVISRRRLAVAAMLLLAGCSSSDSGNTNYTQFYQLAKQSLSASFGNVRVTRDQAAAIPYASIGYSIDGGNQMLLVLATDTNGELLWTGPSHAVIVTREGRIVRTVGLGHDLAALTTREGVSPSPGDAVKGPFSTTRLEDFPELGLYGVRVSCRAHLVGRQTVNILGQGVVTNRVDEACRSEKPEWSFVDSYWVDSDNGQVWRSRQHIHPKGGEIETELFRPPG
ncbi:MAG TPA: YjbF family lipoprotein [Rhizomicrobium sp.]|nr:YjbF family lipoprotein [Rhizomicrobium sp.]